MSALGGPGLACQVIRVRRLEAGELHGAERDAVEAHVAGCARCQATRALLAAERAGLAAGLPFEAFAAGVAERLARPEAPAPRRVRLVRWVPVGLAAGLALAIAAPWALRAVGGRPDLEGEAGERSKGAPTLVIWVGSGPGPRALEPLDPIPLGAPLRVEVGGAGDRHVVVALVDEDGAALLHAGAGGLAPGSFEWTGRRGAVVAVVKDGPLDPWAVVARLQAGGAAAAAPLAAEEGPGAVVLVAPLRRGAGP